MLLPIIYSSMNTAIKEQQANEILQLNEETRMHGLTLTAREAKEMVMERNRTLQKIGRIDLSMEPTKEIILKFSSSAYITQDNYVETLYELNELFYYFKNETEDKIGDEKLISIIKEYYENSCNGSLELLKGTLQEFAVDFRKNNTLIDLQLKGDTE